MSLIDEKSPCCLRSELELFQMPPTNVTEEESRKVDFFPVTSLARQGPIIFQLTADDYHYIDTSDAILYLQCCIVNRDGTDIPRQTNVGGHNVANPHRLVYPENLFGASLFKNLEVYLNDKLISENDNLYPYRAYIQTIITYSKAVKDTVLQTSLFTVNTQQIDENFAPVLVAGANTNVGQVIRWQSTQFSKRFEVATRLYSEIFNINRLLPDGSKLKIVLHPHESAFCLKSPNNAQGYRVIIDHARLRIRHTKITDSVRIAHAKTRLTMPMIYPFNKTIMKFYTHPAGHSDISENNLVTGNLPKKVTIGIVRSEGFHGHYEYSGLNFAHFHVSNIGLRKGNINIPHDPLELDYANDIFHLAYLTLQDGTGPLYRDNSPGISINEYKNYGCTLYCFDTRPSPASSEQFDLVTEGTLSLTIKLAQVTPYPVTVVVALEYDAYITIDNNKLVTCFGGE